MSRSLVLPKAKSPKVPREAGSQNRLSQKESGYHFNGVNGTTGLPLTPPLSHEDMLALACGEAWDLAHLGELQERKERADEDPMGLMYGECPKQIHRSGWGIIFPYEEEDALRRAMSPLMRHRQSQAGLLQEGLYRELTYLPHESKSRFLARHGVAPGAVDPRNFPYFLLLVGGAEAIPFHFQYQLDVQYAVGRVHFETLEDYARYAENVVNHERSEAMRPRRVTFFGVDNEDDRATARSLKNLIRPLEQGLKERTALTAEEEESKEGWKLDSIVGDGATKAELARCLGGERTPALLFTASHGMGFDRDDTRLMAHQGALLCQDWPGPQRWRGPIPENFYFAGEDIDSRADLAGLITFHFACYSAGTPKYDDYAHRESKRRQLAPYSLTARLPQSLLAHPKGGALAVVGHVDRAWSYSFDWKDTPSQIEVFSSALHCLLDGYPIGAAMEYFNQRYAELSTELSSEIEQAKHGMLNDFMTLSGLWTANNDARSYVVLGDPAVRLAG